MRPEIIFLIGVLGFAFLTMAIYRASAAGRVGDDWWHETIRLYVAESDATPIFQACLEQSTQSVKVLVLAAVGRRCDEQLRRVDAADKFVLGAETHHSRKLH